MGAFGDKWYKIATGNGVPSDIFKSELGQPTTPEMVDAALSTGKYDTICITHTRRPPASRTRWRKLRKCLKIPGCRVVHGRREFRRRLPD